MLTVEGTSLGGTFHMGEDRELRIEQGSLTGNKLKFVVKRDRPDGGTMVYQMSATVTGKRMEGEVRTQFNDEEVKRAWQAVRTADGAAGPDQR